MKNFCRTALLATSIFLSGICLDAQEVRITRLNDGQPIISGQTFIEDGYPEEDGGNINGPCLVKLPSWLKKSQRVDPHAAYYLYFAHHKGRYLRLAWSEKLTGPYHLVQDSKLYGKKENAVYHLEEKVRPIGGTSIRSHVASPMVVVDNENKVFKLYFHSPTLLNRTGKNIGQKTYYATSRNGLDFGKGTAPMYLGDYYFSPFRVDGRWYAFANHGYLYRAPEEGETAVSPGHDEGDAVWEERTDFFDGSIKEYCTEKGIDPLFSVRHIAQVQLGNVLHIFFSCREDAPERMYYTSCKLDEGNYKTWKAGPMKLVMQAEEEWEGSQLVSGKSKGGSAKKALNEVRDPFIYTEKGKLYLLYCAGGEKGIGIAQLEIKD